MAKLKIFKYGSDVLRAMAQPVENISDETQKMAQDMLRIMYDSDGVGLAAPQVGISSRIIVIDVNSNDLSCEPLIFINPEIIKQAGQVVAEEGCLSVPDVRGEVKRAEKVTLEALNLDGEKVRIEAADLLARALQHEIDHLNGVLFIDHLGRLKRQLIKKQLRKLENETKAEQNS